MFRSVTSDRLRWLLLGVAAEDVAGERALRRAAIALALAAMTRPEGLLVAAALGLVRLVCNIIARRRPFGRHELYAIAWLVGIWGPWFAWRWWYYGWPFPNTYYVKASGPSRVGRFIAPNGNGKSSVAYATGIDKIGKR